MLIARHRSPPSHMPRIATVRTTCPGQFNPELGRDNPKIRMAGEWVGCFEPDTRYAKKHLEACNTMHNLAAEQDVKVEEK